MMKAVMTRKPKTILTIICWRNFDAAIKEINWINGHEIKETMRGPINVRGTTPDAVDLGFIYLGIKK